MYAKCLCGAELGPREAICAVCLVNMDAMHNALDRAAHTRRAKPKRYCGMCDKWLPSSCRECPECGCVTDKEVL